MTNKTEALTVSQYRVTLNSDTGKYHVTTAATGPDKAAEMVCKAQRAPLSAVLAITRLDNAGKPEAKEPQLYAVEFTDTYGGEANYCWIQRFRVWAKDIKHAITRAKQHRYNAPLPPHRLSLYGADSARIDMKNAPICAFIEWTGPDADTANDEGEIINQDAAPTIHRPRWWEQATAHGLIQLQLTANQATEATPAGQDAQPYIDALKAQPEIAAQLDAIPTDAIRDYLRETGAWNAEELASDADNRDRLLWLACCDIAEEYRTETN